MANRDLVRFQPNERVDLPDFLAVQQGGRSETHSAMYALGWNSQAGAGRRWVLKGFAVTASGSPDSNVTVAGGTAVGIAVLDNGDEEPGVFFGADDPASQAIDFTGSPNGTYNVYIRFKTDTAEVANRVFWDSGTDAEVVGSMGTRNAVTWDVTHATSSPGNEWQPVASVVWGGSTIATGNITKTRRMLFEGIEPTYAHEWGDGGNDRNVARATYGVTDLFTFVHAMRRQIEEIVGDGQKWYTDFDRLSSTKFQIGDGASNYWNAANMLMKPTAAWRVYAPTQTDPSIEILNSDPMVAITSRGGNDLNLAAVGGGDVRVEAFNNGDVIVNTDDMTITCADDFVVAAANIDISSGGTVNALEYRYQSGSERMLRVMDLSRLYMTTHETTSDMDDTHEMHDSANTNLAVIRAADATILHPTLALKITTNLTWSFLFHIDDLVPADACVLHSVAIVIQHDVTGETVTCELFSVANTGGAVTYSSAATDTAAKTHDNNRETLEFVLDELIGGASNMYQLELSGAGGSGVAIGAIFKITLAFDVGSVETAVGIT